ncbi:MAG: GAF domain-containing protein [Nocardioides sp.]|nr:GAF domain-containing protein [Nocardioides sp.]
MEFLSHTQEALDEYLDQADPDLERSLMTMSDSVTRIVPECVGMSLTLYDEDITFTLVASSLAVAEIDAMQYIDGGPCVWAVEENAERSEDVAELLDEERWALFARASSAAGVASTLSLPVLDEDRVIGGINLYASSPEAFSGHHTDLAAALGASATGAVTNADLAFETRRRAELAPGQLRDQRLLDVGIGILAAREGLDVGLASTRLQDAAVRAGITQTQAALVLIKVHQG